MSPPSDDRDPRPDEREGRQLERLRDLGREALGSLREGERQVTLRDLEAQGPQPFEVVRAVDVERLVAAAVSEALAGRPGGAPSAEERQRLEREVQAEVDLHLAERRALLEEKREVVRAQARLEEAKQRLEDKVADLNRRIMADKRAFDDERRRFEERRALLEASVAGTADALPSVLVMAALDGELGPADAADLEDRLAAIDALVRREVAWLERARDAARAAAPAEPAGDSFEGFAERVLDALGRGDREPSEAPPGHAAADPGSRDQALEGRGESKETKIGGHLDGSPRERLARELQRLGGSGPVGRDWTKWSEQLQLGLSQHLRESLGSLGSGEDMGCGDLSPQALHRLIANRASSPGASVWAGRTLRDREPAGDAWGAWTDAAGVTWAWILDASGRHPEATAAAATAATTMRSLARVMASPAAVLREANAVLHDLLEPSAFVCGLLLCYDRRGGVVTWASAGWERLAVYRGGERRAETIRSGGIVLGAIARWPEGACADRELHLAPGDALVLCSDGVLEAQGPDGQLLAGGDDLRRLLGWIETSGDLQPPALVDALSAELRRFTGDRGLVDDATFVVVARRRDDIDAVTDALNIRAPASRALARLRDLRRPRP